MGDVVLHLIPVNALRATGGDPVMSVSRLLLFVILCNNELSTCWIHFELVWACVAELSKAPALMAYVWKLKLKIEKKKKEKCTMLIPKGNSYCHRKSNARGPWMLNISVKYWSLCETEPSVGQVQVKCFVTCTSRSTGQISKVLF